LKSIGREIYRKYYLMAFVKIRQFKFLLGDLYREDRYHS